MSFEAQPDPWRDEDGWRVISYEQLDALYAKLHDQRKQIAELEQAARLREVRIVQLETQLVVRHLRYSEGAVSGPLAPHQAA